MEVADKRLLSEFLGNFLKPFFSLLIVVHRHFFKLVNSFRTFVNICDEKKKLLFSLHALFFRCVFFFPGRMRVDPHKFFFFSDLVKKKNLSSMTFLNPSFRTLNSE